MQPPQSRPLLLRRGTAENATGSFKKRSLKLRRGTKEGKDTECEACEYINIVISIQIFGALYEKLGHSKNRRFRLIRITSNCLVYCKIKLLTIQRINRYSRIC